MVVYHGTTARDFQVFNTSPNSDVGSHFGSLGAAADVRASGAESVFYPVYLSIQNPLIEDAFGGDIGGTASNIRLTNAMAGAHWHYLSWEKVRLKDLLQSGPVKFLNTGAWINCKAELPG